MKIILKSKVNGLGQAGELCRVKPGYARNYLIPKGLAEEATEEKIKIAQILIEKNKKTDNKNKTSVVRLIDKLSNQTIKIISSSTSEGKLYGSIGIKELILAIKDQLGLEVGSGINFNPEIIKHTGTHKIACYYSDNKKVKITLIVKPKN
ncbi:MAG: 50S ribosomal protein L9 [bacterium]